FFGRPAALGPAFLALWAPIALGLASGSAAGLAVAAGGVATAAVALGLARAGAPATLLGATLAFVPGAAFGWLGGRRRAGRGAIPGRRRWPMTAMIRHDLLAVWRLDRDALVDAWTAAIPAYVAMRALSSRASPLTSARAGLLVVAGAGVLGAVA